MQPPPYDALWCSHLAEGFLPLRQRSPYPIGPPGTGITGAPYSATETTVSHHNAADGRKFTNTRVSLFWRDAEGRTREEHLGKTSSGEDFRSVIVTDPVAGTRVTWNVRSGHKWALSWRLRNQSKTSRPRMVTLQTWSCGEGCTREILGAQQVNGVDTQGLRTTTVIDIGTGENGQTLTGRVVVDAWVSPDLGINMRYILDDPRSGRTTMELTDVKRDDPDPALFNAQAGYEVRNAAEGH